VGGCSHSDRAKSRHDLRGPAIKRITTCLWFDTAGEEAAEYYTSVFPDSTINSVSHYGEAGPRPAGSVLTVDFELDGQPFVALNGGPELHLQTRPCPSRCRESQAEVDDYWSRLGEGGEEGQCDWLKDKYGLSWQIIPTALGEVLGRLRS